VVDCVEVAGSRLDGGPADVTGGLADESACAGPMGEVVGVNCIWSKCEGEGEVLAEESSEPEETVGLLLRSRLMCSVTETEGISAVETCQKEK
jgi:hypothetical protein